MSLAQMTVAALAAVLLVLAAVFAAARRDRKRHVEEPTDLLPEIFIDADDEHVVAEAAELLTEHGFEVLTPDPVVKHFDEAERLLRGECDADIAALYDRKRLAPYEDELQTIAIRRLTRRLERLPRT